VTTPRGILGVDVRVGEDLLVADDARGIAEHAARVLLDDELARRLARSARATFDDRLSWERAAYPPLSALVARLRSDVTRPSES
jgi:glycosyltransferase involved in cell wall biosynthesis